MPGYGGRGLRPTEYPNQLERKGQGTPQGGLGLPPLQSPQPRNRPPGLASPSIPGVVEDMAEIINGVIQGFRAYRDTYWPGMQEFATQGRPEPTRENVREAWNGFLDMLRDAFDRFEDQF